MRDRRSLFSLSSLLCGLAPSAGWLIAFRGLQAVGGALLAIGGFLLVPLTAHTGGVYLLAAYAWAVLGGCGLVALALGVISTSNWAKAAAARGGQRLAAENPATDTAAALPQG